jgi:hypothetical protein
VSKMQEGVEKRRVSKSHQDCQEGFRFQKKSDTVMSFVSTDVFLTSTGIVKKNSFRSGN